MSNFVFNIGDKVRVYDGRIGIISELCEGYNSNNYEGYEMYSVDIHDLNGRLISEHIKFCRIHLTLIEYAKIQHNPCCPCTKLHVKNGCYGHNN